MLERDLVGAVRAEQDKQCEKLIKLGGDIEFQRCLAQLFVPRIQIIRDVIGSRLRTPTLAQ